MGLLIGAVASLVLLLVVYGLVKRYFGVEISARVITALAAGVAVVVAAGSGAPQEVLGHLAPTLEVLASRGTP